MAAQLPRASTAVYTTLFLGVVEDVNLPEPRQELSDEQDRSSVGLRDDGIDYVERSIMRPASPPAAAPRFPAAVRRCRARRPGRRRADRRTPRRAVPTSSPVRTSTHSALPSRTRTTNVRSVVAATLPLGTNSDGAGRRTGHRTWRTFPGPAGHRRWRRRARPPWCACLSRPPGRSAPPCRRTSRPGYAATVNGTRRPAICRRVRLRHRNDQPQAALSTSRSSGVAAARWPDRPARRDGRCAR